MLHPFGVRFRSKLTQGACATLGYGVEPLRGWIGVRHFKAPVCDDQAALVREP